MKDKKILALFKQIGENIKRCRMLLGLTQESLAEQAGIADPSYISKIENGKGEPSLSVLYRIAEGLKVSPDKLLKEFTESETGSEDEVLVQSIKRALKPYKPKHAQAILDILRSIGEMINKH